MGGRPRLRAAVSAHADWTPISQLSRPRSLCAHMSPALKLPQGWSRIRSFPETTAAPGDDGVTVRANPHPPWRAPKTHRGRCPRGSLPDARCVPPGRRGGSPRPRTVGPSNAKRSGRSSPPGLTARRTGRCDGNESRCEERVLGAHCASQDGATRLLSLQPGCSAQ